MNKGDILIGFQPPAGAASLKEATLLPDQASVENAMVIINNIATRLKEAERRLDLKVDGNGVRAAITLSEEDMLVVGDQVSVLGQLTIADWVRDMSGGASANVDPAITRIIGDKVKTGQIESNNWGSSAGSQFNLDSGKFKLGGSTSPKLSWNGTTLSITGNITLTNQISSTNISDVAAYSASQDKQKLSTLNVDSPTGSGLFMDATHLGYYTGGAWNTYMDNTGKFYLGGTSGALQWNGSQLTISGSFAGGAVLANSTVSGFTFGVSGGNGITSLAGQISGTSASYWAAAAAGKNINTGDGSGLGNVGVVGSVAATSGSYFGGYFVADGGSNGVGLACSGSLYGLSVNGGSLYAGDLTPAADNTYDLATGWSANWANIYTSNLYCSWTSAYGLSLYDSGTMGAGAEGITASASILSSSYYYSGTPTNGTGPFINLWSNGKIMAYLDVSGTFYNSTNW